jgi:hypothetical protein
MFYMYRVIYGHVLNEWDRIVHCRWKHSVSWTDLAFILRLTLFATSIMETQDNVTMVTRTVKFVRMEGSHTSLLLAVQWTVCTRNSTLLVMHWCGLYFVFQIRMLVMNGSCERPLNIALVWVLSSECRLSTFWKADLFSPQTLRQTTFALLCSTCNSSHLARVCIL